MKLTTTAVAVTAFASLSSSAWAQDAMVEGPGYQVGEGTVFHPSVGVETGYDSNVFYEEADPTGSALLRLLAKFAISNIEDAKANAAEGVMDTGAPPSVAFRLGARLAYQEYLSSNDNARAQRDLGVGADAELTISPEGTVPIRFADHFVRSTRPTNFESSNKLARDVNQASVDIAYKPAESTLSTSLTVRNTIDFFESEASRFANRIQNDAKAEIALQYRPITRFFIDGHAGLYDGLGSESTHIKSTPVRGHFGIATALTEDTTFRGHIGYGAGLYDSGPSYSGILGRAEFGLRYSPVGRVTLAYWKDFRDSTNANYYGEHRIALTLDQQLSAIMLKGNAAIRFRDYEGVPMNFGGGASRSDFIVSAGLSAHYILREWLALTASYDMAVVDTDYRTNFGSSSDDPSYVRHQAMAGATAAF